MRNKNIVIFLLILVLSLFSIIIFFSYKENDFLEKEILVNIKENDSLQNKLFESNKKLLEVYKKNKKEIDSIKNEKYSNINVISGVTLNDKPISIDEVIQITNKSLDENDKLKKQKLKDSLLIDYYKKVIHELEEKGVLWEKNNRFYFDNKQAIDSIRKAKLNEISNLEYELKAKNALLKLIENNYGIKTNIEKNKGVYNVKLLNNKKLDSALWLFPHYKHKIKTNKKGETIIK
ncbi:hypothetical protein FHR24_003086 [Wenyingzhuangia heitensis]|uniref:SurA N-terminal domain-containing protein n=1 Tax=Wenyingzhuangia heitensis TaxID=1487859 RepID=A0ABX0UGD5_9FLAO|nr:hypothetical protein [Wenyingzhuangia heitensis]NIJ46596.1 hypothetical protein [Wenyingzhuangia heitensis]